MIFISAYHRIIWFHNRVIDNYYPNARTLSERYEISTRQAQRDIEYLRDSMNAPLMYCAKKHGYIYNETYSLPQYFLTETEKEILNAMVDDYSQIGSYGYTKYNNYARILSKIYSNNEKPLPSCIKEPYIAELKFLEERTSVSPLEYFACQRKGNDIVLYTFFDPDIFMSVLLSSHLKFQILRPQWLKTHIERRLTDILSML